MNIHMSFLGSEGEESRQASHLGECLTCKQPRYESIIVPPFGLLSRPARVLLFLFFILFLLCCLLACLLACAVLLMSRVNRFDLIACL